MGSGTAKSLQGTLNVEIFEPIADKAEKRKLMAWFFFYEEGNSSLGQVCCENCRFQCPCNLMLREFLWKGMGDNYPGFNSKSEQNC